MIEKFNDDYDFYFKAKGNKDGLGKFLKEMNMDLSTDIRYDKIVYGNRKCVCGQPIKKDFAYIIKEMIVYVLLENDAMDI